MSGYTIEEFWIKRLGKRDPNVGLDRPGWSGNEVGLPTFKEAPLRVSTEMSQTDPATSSIILVSAPGAVGKSTLARQIASETGAIYIDLAKAAAVGGDSISGGLAKTGLFESWKSGASAILLDGLDEARLRVTQEAFAAFLQDVSDIAKDRNIPTVLFGRTGAVQEAWLMLSDWTSSVAILEIGFYDPEAAIDFTMAIVAQNNPDGSHRTVEKEAVSLLLSRISDQTKNDGDRFAGYAPVLQAVARRVSLETNSASLVAQIKQGAQSVTLQDVVGSIIDRERTKLESIPFQDQTLRGKLYSHDEQLSRLVARIYGTSQPELPAMSTRDLEAYTAALESWVPEHPFLNGARAASSAVFDAVIVSHALKVSPSSLAVLQHELARGAAANPFLAEFYLPNDQDSEGRAAFVPPEHIGILYSSLRARLSLGDTANLSIDGGEDADDLDSLSADVEIILSRGDKVEERVLSLQTEQAGTFKLGSYIGGMNLDIPLAKVEIGPASEAFIFAPISIQCDELRVTASRLFIEAAIDKKHSNVHLSANKFTATEVLELPHLRGDVRLSVIWPDAKIYPWTSFVVSPTEVADPRVHEGLRRFRKFVIAFRSHSKGELARFSGKIDHERMTKGVGQNVLDYLKLKKIITLKSASDPMYILNPDLLGELTGATYAQCMAHEFTDKTVNFIKEAVSDS